MVGKADKFSYFRKNLAFMIGNFPNSKFIKCTALFEIKVTKKKGFVICQKSVEVDRFITRS